MHRLLYVWTIEYASTWGDGIVQLVGEDEQDAVNQFHYGLGVYLPSDEVPTKWEITRKVEETINHV